VTDVAVHHQVKGIYPDEASRPVLDPELAALPRGKLLLGYQQRFYKARQTKGLIFEEKSRRIGLTWGVASYSTLRAARARSAGGRNQLYISYALDMTREYIDYCAMWAKAYGYACSDPQEYLFEDTDPDDPGGESRYIKAFRIDFASGRHIRALSSAPRSLRGKQGDVIIDEAAFVDHLGELLDAAIALTIWGGDVTVISSHFGVDNAFNIECNKIRTGERKGRVFRTTFDDALEDGLYERVCLVSNQIPTPEGKATFREDTYGMYGAGAAQELDCVPSRSSGAWLPFDLIDRAENKALPVVRLALADDFVKWPPHAREAWIKDWCRDHLDKHLVNLGKNPIGYGDDFARSSDLSVIWLLEERQDRSWTTPLVVEMRNVPFEQQYFVRVRIMSSLRRFRAKIDAGGNGSESAEKLAGKFGLTRVEAVKARDDWWRDEGAPLKARFEDGRIEIPCDTDIAADIRQVRVIAGSPRIPEKRNTAKGEDASNAAGVVKRHADAAVALFHASAALREGACVEVEGETSEPTGAPAGYLGAEDASPYEPLELSGY
jgi:phage FluMu gp28-like protein